MVEDSKTFDSIPWFFISKPELGGGKVKWKLIADCRDLNHHFKPSFKLDHLQQIFTNLMQGRLGAKVDLKDAYFLSCVYSPRFETLFKTSDWRSNLGVTRGCFGLNAMPNIFMSIMKTFEK